MKKSILTITLFTFLLLLTGCITKEQSERNIFSSEEDSLSYQLVSSVQMLESLGKTDTRLNLSSKTNLNEASDDVSEKEEVEKYLALMEELLQTNGGFNSVKKDSDRAEYSMLLEITTMSLKGEETKYSMYYNETLTQSEVDDDEVEVSTKIEGIAVVNGEVYQLDGYQESETSNEDDETETESYFRVIIDQNNYVIVTEEVESEKNEYSHEFSYEVITDGKRTSKVSFELEKENNELSITLKDSSLSGKSIYTFDLEEILGVKYIHIKVVKNQEVTHIRVKSIVDENGNNKYEYKYVTK